MDLRPSQNLKKIISRMCSIIPVDLRKDIDIKNNNNNNENSDSLVKQISSIILQLSNKDLKSSFQELKYWISTNQIRW
jgi:hypothetical protein